jgi:uncharacterized repeat protein (TIGR03803 family)
MAFTPQSFRSATPAITACIALCLAALATQAQTFTVLHTFTRGSDGGIPMAGLIADRAGNLYGTASTGGTAAGCGTVFQLKPSGSSWLFTPLYAFRGGIDGCTPQARMVQGTNGLLYGTTVGGGGNICYYWTCGTAFQLSPSPTICKSVNCDWSETVIHRFAPTPAMGNPSNGPMVFDQAGNLYGISGGQGAYYFGGIYELSRGNGEWTLEALYNFPDGGSTGGLVFDSAGNLYGSDQGSGYGGVFQFAHSGAGWRINQLFSIIDIFGDGFITQAGVTLDNAGNVYASTEAYGPNGGGTVFELSAGTWNFNLVYGFSGNDGPDESLTFDAAGNLYGTTTADGAYGNGNVFKLSPSAGGWIYTDLYDFTGGTDGAAPASNVVIDAQGNLYGTASGGGAGSCNHGCGTVWKITP